MRLIFLLLILVFASCREPRTAVSCANMGNSAGKAPDAKGADKDPHFFKRRKSKAERGYRRREKPDKSHGTKAEKGEKKQRDKTKAEKKIGLFRKKRRDQVDTRDQNKGVFRNKDKKRKKLIRKRVKHPQEGLFPNGKVGI